MLLFVSPLRAEELAQAIISAQPQANITPLPGGMRGIISLDLRKIDVNDALKYFSIKSGLNIVTTKAVTGRITLMVENVPVQDVFDIMLRSNGLAYSKIGDIYNVMTQAEYSRIYGTKFADVREVRIFHLEYAIPDQVFSLLDTLKSEVGRVLVDPESGSVLCMDSPQSLERMEQALAEFEQVSVTRVFTLNYADAKTVEEKLKSRLDEKKVGAIKADERSNQVVVKALPKRLEEIEKIITALDKKTKEVLIDAKLVKVKLGNQDDVGMEWEGLFNVAQENGLTYIGSTPFASMISSSDDWVSRSETFQNVGHVGSYPFSGTTSDFSSGKSTIGINKLHIGVVGRNDFNTLLTYLRTETSAKILSNPKIAVVNKQEARIHVGERQAYVTTTTTSGTSTSTVSEQVNFIDIGIQMDVTPVINDDDFVSLTLKTEVSSVVTFLNTPTGNQIPIVDTSLAETTVLVKDKGTIVIGGLRREEEQEVIERVPFFSKIPLLGFFFQKKKKRKELTELLIMITPTIISGEVLVAEPREEFGQLGIKAVQGYDKLERVEEEMKTYKSPADEDFEDAKIKSFKLYKKTREEKNEGKNFNLKKTKTRK